MAASQEEAVPSPVAANPSMAALVVGSDVEMKDASTVDVSGTNAVVAADSGSQPMSVDPAASESDAVDPTESVDAEGLSQQTEDTDPAAESKLSEVEEEPSLSTSSQSHSDHSGNDENDPVALGNIVENSIKFNDVLSCGELRVAFQLTVGPADCIKDHGDAMVKEFLEAHGFPFDEKTPEDIADFAKPGQTFINVRAKSAVFQQRTFDDEDCGEMMEFYEKLNHLQWGQKADEAMKKIITRRMKAADEDPNDEKARENYRADPEMENAEWKRKWIADYQRKFKGSFLYYDDVKDCTGADFEFDIPQGNCGAIWVPPTDQMVRYMLACPDVNWHQVMRFWVMRVHRTPGFPMWARKDVFGGDFVSIHDEELMTQYKMLEARSKMYEIYNASKPHPADVVVAAALERIERYATAVVYSRCLRLSKDLVMRSAGALAFHVAYTLSSEETKWDKSDLEIRTETGHRARLSEDFVKKGLKLKIPEIVMGWIQDSANSDVVAAMLDVDSIRGDFESVQLPEWELEFSKWGAMSYQLSDAQHELLTQCMMRLNVNATGPGAIPDTLEVRDSDVELSDFNNLGFDTAEEEAPPFVPLRGGSDRYNMRKQPVQSKRFDAGSSRHSKKRKLNVSGSTGTRTDRLSRRNTDDHQKARNAKKGGDSKNAKKRKDQKGNGGDSKKAKKRKENETISKSGKRKKGSGGGKTSKSKRKSKSHRRRSKREEKRKERRRKEKRRARRRKSRRSKPRVGRKKLIDHSRGDMKMELWMEEEKDNWRKFEKKGKHLVKEVKGKLACPYPSYKHRSRGLIKSRWMNERWMSPLKWKLTEPLVAVTKYGLPGYVTNLPCEGHEMLATYRCPLAGIGCSQKSMSLLAIKPHAYGHRAVNQCIAPAVAMSAGSVGVAFLYCNCRCLNKASVIKHCSVSRADTPCARYNAQTRCVQYTFAALNTVDWEYASWCEPGVVTQNLEADILANRLPNDTRGIELSHATTDQCKQKMADMYGSDWETKTAVNYYQQQGLTQVESDSESDSSSESESESYSSSDSYSESESESASQSESASDSGSESASESEGTVESSGDSEEDVESPSHSNTHNKKLSKKKGGVKEKGSSKKKKKGSAVRSSSKKKKASKGTGSSKKGSRTKPKRKVKKK